jgi:radical SAM superfamily enzyme YgiQ (UPF0313 family)
MAQADQHPATNTIVATNFLITNPVAYCTILLAHRTRKGYAVPMTVELVSCCYEKGNFSFPLGVLCIKEALASHHIPSTVRNWYLSDDPEEAAASVHADIVGLSVYLWNRKWFDSFATKVKRDNPGTILFAGGTEVTANPHSFDLDTYRFLVIGEGEESVPYALEAILQGKEITQARGIVVKGSVFSCGCPEDLSTLPSVFLSHTADPFLKREDTVLWELTRGCPYHCAFCFESKGVRSVRRFPTERIVAELQYLTSHDVHDVFVLDPTFNMDKRRTVTILNLLSEKAPGIHFTFENRAELLNEEIVDSYGKLNCSLQLGMQSSNPEVLRTIDRAADMQAFEKGVRLLGKEGVSFGLDVIIGLPKDTLEGFCKSIDYAISMKPNNIDIFLLSLLPGTTLADRADALGLVYEKQNPYHLIESPTFSRIDIQKALDIKKATDFFYTKGQAFQWFSLFQNAAELPAHTLMLLFSSFLARCQREPDVYEAQDMFVRSILKQQNKTALLPALTSYMELYQGIAYLLETGESPVVELQYDPNDLAHLECMPLDRFAKETKRRRCALAVVQENDGTIGFVDQ